MESLAQARQKFAVRAGGHMNWAGSNNINGGVTIDLGFLTRLTRLGPGANWKDVYAELEKQGRTAAGAREAECGVGGFLLRGSNTFHTPSDCFACDNVMVYEVVLAGGRIVTADSGGEHKGGGNNFGIVTSFQMGTIPSGPVWGGLALRPLDVFPAAADALVDFTATSAKDPDSKQSATGVSFDHHPWISSQVFRRARLPSIRSCVGHQPRFGGSVAITLCNNMVAVENPPVLQRTLALPETLNNFRTTTLEEILTYTSLPPNFYNVWFTLTFKNSSSIIGKAAELHNQLAKELQAKISGEDFTSHVSFQPIPRLFVESCLAVNPSGNLLGLEQNKHDAILIQASASVRTPELEEWVSPKVRAVVEGTRAFAATIEGGVVPWIYLNYAHPSRDVLQSY